ncbi:MAG: phosphoenolpyruvate--protein phosphotransferase [Lachnospiraceae bacterium]
MKEISGIAGAKGKAKGIAVLFKKEEKEINRYQIKDVKKEIEKLQKARMEYSLYLKNIYESVKTDMGEETANIFLAYQEIVQDQFFFNDVFRKIEEEKTTAEFALNQEIQKVCGQFNLIENEYMRERSADIENVGKELMSYILEEAAQAPMGRKEAFVIVAKDLTPADTVKLDKKYVKALVTEKGGRTSHTVILAKTLGIPAIVGAMGVLDEIKEEDLLCVDGDKGTITVNPTSQFIKEFQKKLEWEEQKNHCYQQELYQQAMTKDGKIIEVCINAGDEESLADFDPEICDGIGLFRTEFLYMAKESYPTEEEQFQIYKKVAQKAAGKPVIIRTLDIGGDKQLDYMNLPKEENPFLGYRAIRICLDRKDMFCTQLRAILRASKYGEIRIMFPMIDTLEELREAKEEVQKSMNILKQEGFEYNNKIKIGIMIETPAAVFLSDILAKEADFFSIGSNDLIQYITATDRMNEKVQYLYSNYNISVLRAIKITAEHAHRAGIPVGICGEIASDSLLIPFFVGIGIEELSVVSGQLGAVKYKINHLELNKAKELTEGIQKVCTIEEVIDILEENIIATV